MNELNTKKNENLTRRDFLKLLGLIMTTIGPNLGRLLKLKYIEMLDKKSAEYNINAFDAFEINKKWMSNYNFTTNFDPVHADWLEYAGIINQKITPDFLIQKLKEDGIKSVRLGIRTDKVISYGIDYYKEWFDAFKENDIGITMAFGIKSPRWPETHIPQDKLTELYPNGIPQNKSEIGLNDPLSEFTFELQKSIYMWVQDNGYNLEGIQVENEPFNQFGVHSWTVSQEQICKELELAYEFFPETKLSINSSIEVDQINKSLNLIESFKDKFPNSNLAINLNQYFITPNLGKYLNTLQSIEVFKSGISGLVFTDPTENLFDFANENNIEVGIAEFQVEPWREDSNDTDLLMPGNSLDFFIYSLMQSHRLFNLGHRLNINFPDSTNQTNRNLSLWGYEELITNLGTEAIEIRKLISKINN